MLKQLLAFSILGAVNCSIGLAVIFVLMIVVGLSPGLANLCGYAVGPVGSFCVKQVVDLRAPSHEPSCHTVRDHIPGLLHGQSCGAIRASRTFPRCVFIGQIAAVGA